MKAQRLTGVADDAEGHALSTSDSAAGARSGQRRERGRDGSEGKTETPSEPKSSLARKPTLGAAHSALASAAPGLARAALGKGRTETIDRRSIFPKHWSLSLTLVALHP